jgi:hypothetical protein
MPLETGQLALVQFTFRTPLMLDQRFFPHACFEGAFECENRLSRPGLTDRSRIGVTREHALEALNR